MLLVEEVDVMPHSGASEETNVATLCEIADIVDNISMGLKCRGNNHKRHNKRQINGGKLSSLLTQTHLQTQK